MNDMILIFKSFLAPYTWTAPPFIDSFFYLISERKRILLGKEKDEKQNLFYNYAFFYQIDF